MTRFLTVLSKLRRLIAVKQVRYTAIFEVPPDGGYHAFCPGLPGRHLEEGTLEEAIVNIRESIAVCLRSLLAHGEAFPIENILINPLDIAIAS